MGWKRLLLLLLAALCVASPAHAFTGKKIALVMANGAYADGLSPLENPAIDASLLAQALRREGFAVTVVQDADLQAMKRAVVEHAERLREAGSGSVSFIHYSGHGAADTNRSDNYLIPVGAPISSELALPTLAYRLSDMVATVEAAKPAVSFISVDACRNIAFPHAINRSGAKGLAKIDEARGTLIAFATAPGSVAEDGQGEQGSTFSRVLAEEISKGGETHVDVFKNVQIAVSDATKGRQVPWYTDGIVGRFTFQTDGSAPPPTIETKSLFNTRAVRQVVQESEAERRERAIEARESLARMGQKVDAEGLRHAIIARDEISIPLYVDSGIKLNEVETYYIPFENINALSKNILELLISEKAIEPDGSVCGIYRRQFNWTEFDKRFDKLNSSAARTLSKICNFSSNQEILQKSKAAIKENLDIVMDETGNFSLPKCIGSFSTFEGRKRIISAANDYSSYIFSNEGNGLIYAIYSAGNERNWENPYVSKGSVPPPEYCKNGGLPAVMCMEKLPVELIAKQCKSLQVDADQLFTRYRKLEDNLKVIQLREN